MLKHMSHHPSSRVGGEVGGGQTGSVRTGSSGTGSAVSAAGSSVTTGSGGSASTAAMIPGLEDLHLGGSPILESRNNLQRLTNKHSSNHQMTNHNINHSRSNHIINDSLNLPSSSSNNRPVSVHGNVIANQSIYANTVPLNKLNLSQSVPNNHNAGANNHRLGNLNLNTSSNHNSSTSASPNTNSNATRTTNMDSSTHSHHELNTTQISPINKSQRLRNQLLSPQAGQLGLDRSVGVANRSQFNSTHISKKVSNNSLLPANVSKFMLLSKEVGVKEMITSLALLCLVSLLLALLSLVVLLKISPVNRANARKLQKFDDFLAEEEFLLIYQVTLAMVALTLSLNLCCLLVCAIQFLFAIKLVKAQDGRSRTTKYLKEASITRTCAIGGFFVSIPVFLIGIILFTFLNVDSTPAIITSVMIGLGIVFCGAAVVHNVLVWQREKMKAMSSGHMQMIQVPYKLESGDNNKDLTRKSHGGLPQATLDLSAGPNGTMLSSKGLELSTLV